MTVYSRGLIRHAHLSPYQSFPRPGTYICNMFGQVTRLACGGFTLAVRLNHTMADAQGLTQFLGAVAELARGAPTPTVRPVWQRELLETRDPPRPCFPHHEFDDVPDDAKSITTMALDEMVCHTFFFTPQQVAALRAQLVPHLRKQATSFDIVAGSLWKCRTVALSPESNLEMRMSFSIDARGRRKGTVVDDDGIPTGYYGNAFATPTAISTARELCVNPLSYAVELVKKAKDEVGMDYMRSMADVTVLQKRTCAMLPTSQFALSDTTKAKFSGLNFGWGKPVYGGPAEAMGIPMMPWICSFILPLKNAKGEHGVAVPMYLPTHAMDKMVEEMAKLLRAPANDVAQQQTRVLKRSAL
jgi:benzyl alcohol O-benzoyltransferase